MPEVDRTNTISMVFPKHRSSIMSDSSTENSGDSYKLNGSDDGNESSEMLNTALDILAERFDKGFNF